MHPLVVSLLIACILACPYECAAKALAAQLSPATEKICCEACLARNSSTSNQNSDRSNLPASEDGVSCLCEGVILNVTSQLAVEHAIHSSWDVVVPGACLQPQLPCLDRFENGDGVPPARLGGALVRILNQSFLL
jgi:hypothetical protein